MYNVCGLANDGQSAAADAGIGKQESHAASDRRQCRVVTISRRLSGYIVRCSVVKWSVALH